MSGRIGCITTFASVLFTSSMAIAASLTQQTQGTTTTLYIDAAPIHSTQSSVTGATLTEVTGTTVLLVRWYETPAGGSPLPYYAFGCDANHFAHGRRTDYFIRLLFAQFDPLTGVPALPSSLQADAANRLHIVQFFTQPLSELENGITAVGGIIRDPLGTNAEIVEMSEAVRAAVAALPYVRWVGPYHPGYRLEDYLRDNWSQGGTLFPSQLYTIMVFESGLTQKNPVAARIQSIGGTVNVVAPEGFILMATLTPTQLQQVIRWDEVAFVDRLLPPVLAMDKARKIGGAALIEGIKGYTGQGVRGEVLDTSVQLDHPAFRGICVGGSSAGAPCSFDSQCPGGTCEGEPIIHGVNPTIDPQHSTRVHGCLFGDGTGSTVPGAKGMIPDAQSIVASYCSIPEGGSLLPQACGGFTPVSRHTHTQQLLDTYSAVFQSNSWGSERCNGCSSFPYTNLSAELDDIVVKHEILICQAQGNAINFGARNSAPQAWAKNVVSVGGVRHFESLKKADHHWQNTGCIGPAEDGRIKPDLVHFYDGIYTTDKNGGYFESFEGTSAATPITCGHFGLFFQMWHEGTIPGFGGGASVFASRPHATTAKAMLINTAEQYPFVGTGVDMARTHQGWGFPSVGKLYKMRRQFPVIIDETVALQLCPPNNKVSYSVAVGGPTRYSLKATLVYTDPKGRPTRLRRHTVNDLDLIVTSPTTGTTYWGNYGLRTGNWSTSGGGDDANDDGEPGTVFDTVENVFIPPALLEEGTWNVQVRAEEIYTDMIPGGVRDVDFALVVSLDYDCNGNGRADSEDLMLDPITLGGSYDYDDNSVPDECQGLYYVKPTGTSGNGLSWPTAFTGLQTAIDAAQLGDRIMVKAGDYGPVTLRNGVAVYGGFAGVPGETSPSQANYRVNVTNIVGNGASPHVVSSINNGPGTILRGFHIKNGNANGSTGNDAHGGGLYLENSNAKIVQCVFTNNDAAGNGAATANMKNADGTAGSPTFVNCTFHRNKDVNTSGDILKGGAVYSEAGDPQFVNCLFHKNEAANGGAVYVEAGQPKFFNCTISDNVATSNGGGIYDKLGQSTVRNGILFFNTATSGSQIRNDSGATVVTYSDVQGTWTGEGNIRGLPRFTDRFADDYTLNVTATPCDDVGRNTDLPADAADIDWDGNITELIPKDLAAPATSGGVAIDRRLGGNCTVDMGALEIQGSCSIP